MKVAVANSSEMTRSNQSQSDRISSTRNQRRFFLQCNFLKALAPFRGLKDVLGMFGLADFQSVSIASRKDLIAKLLMNRG